MVPWARTSACPMESDASSKVLMNSSPMIFLFFSGSVTPLSLLKKRSSAFILMKFIPKRPLKVSSTRSPSSFLRRPWSTKTHVRSLPMALLKSAAHTEESTPPERARRTFLPLSSLRYFSMELSMKSSILQSAFSSAILNRKLERMFFPYSVWVTSGWNCTP